MDHITRIKAIENITHDVKRFQCERPEGYSFHPGQATEVSVNKPGWVEEKRPFSFTSLNDSPDLEFIIKIYKDHEGVTSQLDGLKPGDELIIRDVWGVIEYKGPGYFIAGGAGITPFIAILRQLKAKGNLAGNKLFFSNKSEKDIILQTELTDMLNGGAVYSITDEPTQKYYAGFINRQFLEANVEDYSRHFYMCGPPPMVEALQPILLQLGASPDALVFER